MTDRTNRPPSEVLGALPRSRPHRRSAKRASTAGVTPDPKRSERAPTAVPAPPAAKRAKRTPAPPAASPKRATPTPAPQAGSSKRATPTPAPPAGSPKRARPVRSAEPAHRQRLRQPPQPRGLPPTPPEGRERPSLEASHDLLGGTVRAAAELTEVGLTTSARMLRAAVSWLPRR